MNNAPKEIDLEYLVPIVKAPPRGASEANASIVHQHGNLDEYKHM